MMRFSTIIEFLVNNKEWIFSGIGVFLLGGIAAFIKGRIRSKKASNSNNYTQINLNGGSGMQIGTQNNNYNSKVDVYGETDDRIKTRKQEGGRRDTNSTTE